MSSARPLSYKLHIELLSDWHIGTGAGRHGGIDRLVARDAHDLPYVPVSSIRSLWRDAAEMLARGLDGTDNVRTGSWQKLVRDIFGSQPATLDQRSSSVPTPSRLFMTDAGLAPGLRGHLLGTNRHALRDALTFVKSGVAIDAQTGAARDDMLRFEEVAVAGALLEADVEIEAHVSDPETLYWFLAGAAGLIERLGAKRRRGLGRCSVALARAPGTCPDPTPLKAEAANKLGRAKPPSLEPRIIATIDRKSFTGAQAWHEIPLEIELLSPLIIARNVQGNVVTTFDYIPGGQLLPVVANAARAAGVAVDDLIARSALRVLPATIDIDGTRGLPIPFAWSRPKDSGGDAFTAINSLLEPPDRRMQMKGLKGGYVAAAGPAAVRLVGELPVVVRTHNVIDDEHQTPTSDVGGVFTYEALEAGLRLRSVVRLHGTEDESGILRDSLIAASDEGCRIGRAKQAGYGRVRIKPGEVRTRSATSLAGRALSLWLETDALIPGSDLCPATDFASLAASVARIVAPGRTAHEVFNLTASRAALRARQHNSWQGGLPRPSLVVLQAGSIAFLDPRDDICIDAEARARLQLEGIGERRAEGFGCVRVDDELLKGRVRVEKAEIAGRAHPAPSAPIGERERRLLIAITERAWRRWILARAEAVMSQPARRSSELGWKEDGSAPGMSQLGALRSLLPRLTGATSCPVRRWLDHQSDKAAARGVGTGAAWRAKIGELVTKPSAIWTLLGAKPQAVAPPASGVTDELMQLKLWTTAVQTTLLVAMRHHKRRNEQSSTGATAP